MGYQLFGKRGRRDTDGDRGAITRSGDDAATEFAATEATLPPAAPESKLPFYALDEPTPSGIMDSQVMDSRVLPGIAPEPRRTEAAAGRASGFGLAGSGGDHALEAQPTLSHVGRYALKSSLGEGGLGQVHEAWDPLLSRTVAVKTLQFDLPTPMRESLDGMILNEARAAASLNHAYIVTVFDAGLSDHGVYIAMERLQGRDLRQALAAGWVPSPRVAAVLVRRVADALAYAHARGVVHCDIKPANIFIVGRDRPKVLDFGIARIAHGTAVPALDGSVAGSPHYQSPEQVRGTPVDARTDIYALGTVLYELLTGRKAFGGDSVEQIQTAVLTSHPAPAVELRPGVPQALSDIAARAMARDPADRFANATEMSMALRRWAEAQGTPGPLPPETPAQPAPPAPVVPPAAAPRPARLRPALLLAGVLASAGLGALWLRRPGAGDADTAPLAGPAPGAAEGSASAAASAAAAAAGPMAPAPAEVPLVDPAASESLVPPRSADASAPAAAAATPPGATAAGTARPGAPAAAGTPPNASATNRTRTTPARAGSPAADARATPVAGTVQLAISPWGKVEVNGNPVGTAPPLNQLTLPEGTHTITVRNEDFPPFVATVQVAADKPITLRHRFGP